MSTDVTQSRYSQILKRLFAIKGGDSGRVISPIIQPGYDLQDTYRPEERSLRGEKLLSYCLSVTNTVGNFFGQNIGIMPQVTSRVFVLRRATWSINIPTAANQAGTAYIGITQPFAGPVGLTQEGCMKDARVQTNVIGPSATRFTGGAVAAEGYGAFGAHALYQVAIFPGAAAVPFVHQVQDLDIVLVPNTFVAVVAKSSVVPAGAWDWAVTLEGYERSIDPGEVILPP